MLTSMYKSILNSLSEGVCAIGQDGRIHCFNAEAERLTGVAADEALSSPVDVAIPRQCGDVHNLVKAVWESGESVLGVPTQIVNRRGESIPVMVNAAPVQGMDGDQPGIVITFRDNQAIELLRRELRQEFTSGDIVSKDDRIRRMLQILPQVAESDSAVLILGPTGTGKELVARALHEASRRREKPFVAVNCGALPDSLLESELFGYRKGAFTDAKRDKDGRFALAEGGTLFLDEIGDVSLAMQVKLLRVLDQKQYEPLGATGPVEADVRIVAATNRNLAALVEAEDFRADLYFRLNVIEFELPPLAERPGDIPLLVEHFVEVLNAEKGRDIKRVSRAAMTWLLQYHYPGNVRELRNVIERAYVLCQYDEIREDCLPPHLLDPQATGVTAAPHRPAVSLRRLQPGQQRQLITRTLAQHDGHRGRTSEALGIDKSTLWRKMKKLAIEFPDHRASLSSLAQDQSRDSAPDTGLGTDVLLAESSEDGVA